MDKAQAVVQLITDALFLDRDLQDKKREEEKGTSDKLNPYITDSDSCPRKIWFSLRNYEPSDPPDIQTLINFLVGKSVEDGLARVLQQTGLRVDREVKVVIPATLSTEVSGRADFLIFDPNLKTLIELKTTSSKAFAWMKKKRMQGREEHRSQLNLYLEAGQRGLIPDTEPGWFDSGCLVYIIKDAVKGYPALYAYEVPYSPQDARRALQKLSALQEAARLNNYPPERPEGYTYSKYPCSYCSFRTLCWKELG